MIKKMTKKLKTLALLIVIAFSIQGCATILGGSRKSVFVKNGYPPNAKIYYNGSYVGTAPIRVKVQKSAKQGHSYIEIKANGYKTNKVNLVRKASFGYIVLDIITGVVWLGVDFMTGNIYKPRPRKIKYNLELKEGYNALKLNYKVGDIVIFSYGKYKNKKGKIVALYPDRALIKFTREANIFEKIIKKKTEIEKEIVVPFINIAK